MTPAVVALNTPLPTPQLQSQTTTVPTIAQLAHPLTCHSNVELFGCETYPIRSNRKISVRNGIEVTKAVRRMTGDKARRKGLAISSCVVSVSMEDVVCISRGRSNRRRAVIRERMRGIMENKRRLGRKIKCQTQNIIPLADNSPNRLTPRWLLTSFPHETTNECPHCR